MKDGAPSMEGANVCPNPFVKPDKYKMKVITTGTRTQFVAYLSL